MKGILIIISLISSFIGVAQVLTLEGYYRGQNIYVQNPSVSDSSFCTDSVYVNGVRLDSSLNFSAYQIPLDNYCSEIGAPVRIDIYHKTGCTPKVINSNMNPLTHGISLEVMKSAHELDSLIFSLTQPAINSIIHLQVYKWNKWIDRGPVALNNGKYKVPMSLHSDTNKWRLVVLDGHGNRKSFSKTYTIANNRDPITHSFDKKSRKVIFSDKTDYELYDVYGNIVKKGYSDEIQFNRQMKKSAYYINYDNTTYAKIFIRK